MLHLEGDRDFPQPLTDVSAKLSDAGFLARCIPDAESVAVAEPRRAVVQVRPGLSFVRGNLEVTIQVTEVIAGQSARFRLDNRGVGSTATVEAVLQFTAHENGTRVHWTADITQLGGLLKMVPPGLIQASAQKVVGDVWDAIGRRVAEAGTQ
jgi:uncharacterized protein